MEKKILFLSIIALLFISSCQKDSVYNINYYLPNPPNVTVLAGSGAQGSNNGTGNAASFNGPTGLAVDTGGNVYVADFRNNMIREISPMGVVTTLAGTGLQGALNGAGVNASFDQPAGLVLNGLGNMYVSDSGNNLIREIGLSSGTVSTFAGIDTAGFANGVLSTASFTSPQGIAMDASGDIFVADNGSNIIREITAGMVTTVAGKADSTGANNAIDSLATFNEPTSIALDGAGNIYVADFGNNLIRKISTTGSVSTLAGSGAAGHADGTGANASFNGPAGITLDASGNLYVTDFGNNELREITPAGVVTTMGIGTGSAFKKYTFSQPYGIALDAMGNIYVAVYGGNTIQKIAPITTPANAARRVFLKKAGVTEK